MSELLNCPFCGVGARFVKHSAGVRGTMGFDSWQAVSCVACSAGVGACDRRFRNKEDAAQVWNTRAPLPEPSRKALSVDEINALEKLICEETRERLMFSYDELYGIDRQDIAELVTWTVGTVLNAHGIGEVKS